ncbi:hypothetical protein BZA05DRAFT_405174 [Tricharina praecox]|uniref:uncharacterized protein n=1 Tax=Tricharina praecox TaxID=43433 RepID=UPI00222048A2|nr:uncharacterized protein BZA05DRAFT_405174 [Tricharina praecox]KAI5847547.1 hypothetical protein BZA05DRAFT_405174 [Tricharina praecox]
MSITASSQLHTLFTMPGRVKLTSEASVDDQPAPAKRKLPTVRYAAAKRTKSGEEREAASQPRSYTSSGTSSGGDASPQILDDDDGSLITPPSSQPVATTKPKKKQVTKPRPKKYVCTHEGCDKSFARPCRLDEHLRSHSGDRPFKCTFDPEQCDKSFLRDSHLKAHIKAMHIKTKPYRCTFLIPPGREDDRGEFGFKRKASEPAEGPNGMRECGASFSTNQHLKRHVDSHLKTFPYICKDHPPCAAGFRKKGVLTRHIRSEHLGLKPWACPHKSIDDANKPCSAAFDTKGKLGNHVATQHNGLARRRYICTICITTPEAPLVEQPTTSVPTNTLPHAVDLDREVTDQSAEDASLLLNLSQASFPVIQAPILQQPAPEALRTEGMLGFATHAELRSHITLAHPPVCKRCGYIAKRQGDLYLHIRDKHETTVEERQSWVCGWDNCGQGFTKKSNLTIHTRTVHKGLKPFPCTEPGCDKRFGHKAVLARHITSRHSENTTQKSTRKSRKKKTRALNIAQLLTGWGYEASGRDIECVVEGCEYRFCRMYDLKKHLCATSGHGFDETQVATLMKFDSSTEKVQVYGEESESSEDISDSEWSVAGSETESEEEFCFDDDD